MAHFIAVVKHVGLFWWGVIGVLTTIFGFSLVGLLTGTSAPTALLMAAVISGLSLGILLAVPFTRKLDLLDSEDRAAHLPAIRVSPLWERGFRYLVVESTGATAAEFQAEIDIVGGRAEWFGEGGPFMPSLPYRGCWQGYETEGIRLFPGQRARPNQAPEMRNCRRPRVP